jgi:excinuclease ABC subunit A
MPCEVCGGRRYNLDTLAVTFKGKAIAEALSMSVDETRELFAAAPAARRPLDFLGDIGLGYLTLGQLSPTLCGGPADQARSGACCPK